MLGIAAAACKRLGELKAARAIHEAHWAECYRFGAPERQQAFNSGSDGLESKRQSERVALLDSTAAEAIQIMAANIIGGTTPANAQWFKAVPDGVDDPAELTEGEHWLENVCQFMWRNIHGANFDSEIVDLILDYICAGWAVLYTDIDRKKGAGYVFEAWPIGQCYIASTRQDQKIDTIYREFQMTAAAMVNEYGEESCSVAVREAAKREPDKKFNVLWVIEPRKKYKPIEYTATVLPKNREFASYHIEADSKHLLRESGYYEFPCAAPRYRKIPNSVYGVGAMSTVLPEARQLQSQTRDYLRALEMASIGMYSAADDGVLNPRTVRLGPGKIIVVDKTDSIQRIDDTRGVQVSQEGIERTQNSIRRKLMADVLTPPYSQPMTAAETYMRVDMMRQQIGPLYGRAQAELLVPLLERCFSLAYRAEAFGEAPEELQGSSLSFKFISPLARAQQLEDVAAIERLMASLPTIAQIAPDVLDNIDTDAIAAVMAQRLGVPMDVMRTSDQRDQYRQQKAQAQQQAQAQEQQAVLMQQLGGAAAKGVEAQLVSEVRQ